MAHMCPVWQVAFHSKVAFQGNGVANVQVAVIDYLHLLVLWRTNVGIRSTKGSRSKLGCYAVMRQPTYLGHAC
jgi:hypothetical protein